MRSFRIRIALLSAVLAGSAIVGFGLISWWLIYEAKVSRLDAELESQLMRAGRPRSRDRWQSYEAFLPGAFGTNTAIAMLVIDADGNVLYRSEEWAADLDTKNLWKSRPQLQPFPPHHSQRQTAPFSERSQPPPNRPPPAPRFVTQHTAIGTWRIGAVTTPFAQVAIAVSLNAIAQEMAVIRNIFLISIPGVLLLVAGGAWAIAGSSLHSIRRLTKVIGNVTVSGLEQRVPIGATDVEFVELIQVFNQMLERLEHSFKLRSS
nr:HAMP domain-containing protein [Trichocoleus sp. FACHB-40]